MVAWRDGGLSLEGSVEMNSGRSASNGGVGLAWRLLAYAVALTAFLLIPPYLKPDVGLVPGFTQQEAVDIVTPIVVIPLAWLVFQGIGATSARWTVAFLAVAALWVEGHGIHLGTNAIGDEFGPLANVFYATPPGDLAHWLDEILSHWLWHVAWVALTVMFVVASLPVIRAAGASPGGARGSVVSEAVAGLGGLVYGATFFIVTVEGVTTALGIPAALALLAWTGWLARPSGSRHPVVVFVLVSAAATLLGYVAWGALHGWTMPEFSKVGLFQ